ncbi:MAG: DUF2784 domain-containing protein [Thermoplasmatota archaeon]
MNMRLAGIAADLVLLAHFVFVLTAVFGAFLVPVWPGWVWIHVPVVLWSSVVNLAAWTCPLTPLEQRLRKASGTSSYQGGFVQHYIGSMVYPNAMPRRLELVAGTSILVWNLLAYGAVWWWLSR